MPSAVGGASGAAERGQGYGASLRGQGTPCAQSCCLTAGPWPGLPGAGSAITRCWGRFLFYPLPAPVSGVTGTLRPSPSLASLP